MNVIVEPKGWGKTIKLIKKSAETGQFIVTYNNDMAQQMFKLAIDLNLQIPYPLNVHELTPDVIFNCRLHDKGILVDNGDIILESILGVPIDTVTFRKDGEYE